MLWERNAKRLMRWIIKERKNKKDKTKPRRQENPPPTFFSNLNWKERNNNQEKRNILSLYHDLEEIKWFSQSLWGSLWQRKSLSSCPLNQFSHYRGTFSFHNHFSIYYLLCLEAVLIQLYFETVLITGHSSLAFFTLVEEPGYHSCCSLSLSHVKWTAVLGKYCWTDRLELLLMLEKDFLKG